MRNKCICITTYNRPKKLVNLLQQIEQQAPDAFVIVFDDNSKKNYARALSVIARNQWRFISYPKNHGKKRFWELTHDEFQYLKQLKRFDYYWMIQDDMAICRDFFNRTIKLWESVQDPAKISLLLLRDARGSNGKSLWTNQRIKRYQDVSRVQFIDCPAFLCRQGFFDALNWTIHPVPKSRWKNDPALSSGVGAQMSKRLVNKGYSLYRSNKSYVLHSVGNSHLNPESRKDHPLIGDYYVDGHVTASLASIPERKLLLKPVINSLLPQCHRINVFLNGYADVPKFLEDSKIHIARSKDYGNLGDAGKFFWADRITGYHFTCDDDILYPPDYIKTMLNKLKMFQHKVVVGCHGARLPGRISSYYGSRKVYHFCHALGRNKAMHVLGTGTVGYHADTINVSSKDFKHPNMADIWFAKLGQEQEIPFIAIKRSAGWLRSISPKGQSIHAHSRKKQHSGRNTGEMQTKIVKEIAPWRLYHA